MADKFETLYKSINDTMGNDSIENKQIIIITILQQQTFTSLKKLCGKKYLGVSGCSSQKIVGDTKEKKQQVQDLIVKHLFPKFKTEYIQISKPTDTISTLKEQLQEKGISHNITKLTNNKKDKLQELLEKDRCTKNNDYDNCPNNESCFVKNKVCVDKDIESIGPLERRAIKKKGKTYYVLSTQKQATNLQDKIDSEGGESEDEEDEEDEEDVSGVVKKIEDKIDDNMEEIGLEDLSVKKMKGLLSESFPTIQPTFLKYVIKNHLIDSYEATLKPPKEYDFSQGIYITKSPSPKSSPNVEEKSSDRYQLFLDEGMEDVASDGNCFFRCISALLFISYGIEIDYNTCRSDIVKMIDVLYHSDSNLKENFDIVYDISIEEYLNKMSADREWAGELEIIATSILYNVNINVTTERLDSNDNIIPNIMYTPNNLYFKQMSENIIIDDQTFKDRLIWGIYHVGDVSGSGNHYTYNSNIFVDNISFINTFNPTQIEIPFFDKSKYYDRWLEEYYSQLTYSKTQNSSLTIEYSPTRPSLNSPEIKEQLTEYETDKIKEILQNIQELKEPSPMVSTNVEPSPVSFVRPPSPKVSTDETPEEVLMKIGNEDIAKKYIKDNFDRKDGLKMFRRWEKNQFIPIEEKQPIVSKPKARKGIQHPGVRKQRPDLNIRPPQKDKIVCKKIEEQLQKYLELPDESEIEETSRRQTSALEIQTKPKQKDNKRTISNIMSKFKRSVV